MTIIRNPDYLFREDGGLNLKTLHGVLKEHDLQHERYHRLADYYDGKQAILTRELSDPDAPNNKLMINYAEYISDFASSYFMGNEIEYIGDSMDPIREAFSAQHIHMVDTELARDLSRFGVAYELVYMSSDDKPIPKSTNIDPRNAVIVVDDSVEYKTLIGIYRHEYRNKDNRVEGEVIRVYTAAHIHSYRLQGGELKPYEDVTDHPFGKVPLLEYWNKANQTADYESVITLIDAYNILMSDRVNDKEKFVQALLVVYGVLAGDNTEEKIQTVAALKRLGMLEMPPDSKAEYITKSLSESDTEILKNSIKNDIHKISKVPDMTDENFAANASGVAMKYKLLGLEQLAKTKEAYYKMSLRDRLTLYEAVFHVKSQAVSVDDVEIVMRRSLPTNELETASMIVQLKDMVSAETLISQLPFVQAVDAELERLKVQKEESIAMMRQSFGATNYPTFNDRYSDDDEEVTDGEASAV